MRLGIQKPEARVCSNWEFTASPNKEAHAFETGKEVSHREEQCRLPRPHWLEIKDSGC